MENSTNRTIEFLNNGRHTIYFDRKMKVLVLRTITLIYLRSFVVRSIDYIATRKKKVGFED